MFEEASRLKLRFSTPKGLLTVEQLWDLPLTHSGGVSLDDAWQRVNAQLKTIGSESFVTVKTTKDDILKLRLNILEYIMTVKIEEAKTVANAVARKAQKDKILGILAQKEDEALGSKSADELRDMLDKL